MYSNVSTSSLATIILRSLIPGGHSHGLLEKDFFKCNSEAFKAEVIKLVLYKRLSLQNGVQPIAWIGSAKTLTTMLEDPNPSLPERRGIYLNCGEYLTPEFNRAWLLSLMEMGYEIKLVERQFPSIEKAILSNKPIDFLLLLAEEIRKMNDQNDPGACHSQYNGGDSPTATSLEILLLMNMGCTATKDIKEGTISLFKPKITAIDTSEYSSPKPEMLSQYRLSKRRSHSCFMPTASMKYRTKNQLIL